MESFLDENMEPVEFWEGHFSGKSLPKSKEDIKSYLKKATQMIRERGRAMSK